MQDRVLIHSLMQALVLELQHLGEWQTLPPSAEQLASELPFCLDTLTFYQWLQWVFLAKMQHLLAQHQPLPLACAIAPVAVEVIVTGDTHARLLALLADLDAAITTV
jgi:uncharacterized protein YqcC (DUF446 family)